MDVGTGQLVVWCELDRTVRLASAKATMRFDDHDALVAADGMRIYVRDSGEVEAALHGASKLMPWRIVGASPSERRTAEMLIFIAIASIDWHYH